MADLFCGSPTHINAVCKVRGAAQSVIAARRRMAQRDLDASHRGAAITRFRVARGIATLSQCPIKRPVNNQLAPQLLREHGGELRGELYYQHDYHDIPGPFTVVHQSL